MLISNMKIMSHSVFIRKKLICTNFLGTLGGDLNANSLQGFYIWKLFSPFFGRTWICDIVGGGVSLVKASKNS